MTKKPEKQDELSTLKDTLKQKETAIEEHIEHLKRLQAEFENYIKRVEKERQQITSLAAEKVILKLLTLSDDFGRCLNQLKDLPEQAKTGIDMIYNELQKILTEEHVQPITAVGEHLDPYKHEVLLQADSEQPEGIILEELQKGYTMNGKVIRYAKVKVSKGGTSK